jgi:hypothetical protein
MLRNGLTKMLMVLFVALAASCGPNRGDSDAKVIGTDMEGDGTGSNPMRIYYIENQRVVRAECPPNRPTSQEFCKLNTRKMLLSKFRDQLFENRELRKSEIKGYDEQITLGRSEGLDVSDLEAKRNTLDTERNALLKEISQIENLLTKMTVQPLVYSITAEGTEFVEFKPYVQKFNEIFRSAYLVSAGENHTCITDNDGAKCWGGYSLSGDMGDRLNRYLDGRDFKHPVDIASGTRFSCVLDDEGVHCFGEESDVPSTLPDSYGTTTELYTKLYAAKDYVCGTLFNKVTGKQKLNCRSTVWGARSLSKEIATDDNVVLTEEVICVITRKGEQKCLDYPPNGSSEFPHMSALPALFNPKQVVATKQNACAIHEDGLSCWQDDSVTPLAIPNEAQFPIYAGAFDQNICTINSDKTVSCFGASDRGQTLVPPLKNTSVLSVGAYHACALDDSGLKCWGAPPHSGSGSGGTSMPANLNFDPAPRR